MTDPDGRGVYRLTDHFLRFWFRYVPPNRSTLEQGQTEPVRQSIAETLPEHTSWTFEEVCRQAVREVVYALFAKPDSRRIWKRALPIERTFSCSTSTTSSPRFDS